MANNEYVNRVDFGNETLIDISDTTAEPGDVIEGQTFYTRSGAPAAGTLGDATTTMHGLMSATDKVKIDEIDSKKAPIIIDSKSGNPIVINDGISGLKLYDMKVSFAPKQEGTDDPSPTNIRPISGWTELNIHKSGKNLVQFNSQQGPSATFYNGYSGWLTNGSWRIPDTSIKYTYSAYIDNRNASTSSCAKIWFYGADGTTSAGIAEGTQVAAGTEGWSVVYCGNNANRYFAAFGLGLQPGGIATKGMVEIGESRTDYESYSGTTTPISWQSETGEVYGGTLDVFAGVLTVTHKFIDLTNVDWVWVKSSSYSGGFYASIQTNNIGIKTQTDFICSHAKTANILSEYEYGTCYCDGSVNIRIMQSGSELTDWQTYLSEQSQNGTPVCICGELATSYTVQLDPVILSTLIMENVIWTDADTAEIAYPVDTKKYIDAAGSDLKGFKVNGSNMIGQSGDVNLVTQPWIYGIGMNSSSGLMYIGGATSDALKAGSASYLPVTAAKQHESVFYALAKLAGVDLANETVTVGQYPDAAKVAIQKMLGVYESPWEIIREETFTTTTNEDYIITVDGNGEPFELIEAMMLFELPKITATDVDSSKGLYGQIWFIYQNGSKYIAPEPGAFSRVVGGDAKAAWYYIQNNKGLISAMSSSPISNTNSGAMRMRYIQGSWSGMGVFPDDGTFAITSVNIKSILGNARYRLYGRRKWN